MEGIRCPYCGQTAFATLCTDCQAEGIRIQEVKSIFHVGRCQRCGHLDDEPCSARTGSGRGIARAWQAGKRTLRELSYLVVETIRAGTFRPR